MIPEPVLIFISALSLVTVGMIIQACRQKIAERAADHWRIRRDIRDEPRL